MEEKSFCPHCSKEVDGDATFCPYCGTKLKKEEFQGEFYSGNQMYHTESYFSGSETKKQDKDTMSILALIFGICSLVLPFANLATSIVAIIIGSKYKDDVKAKAGWILGVIGLFVFVLEVVLIVISRVS